MKGGEGEREEGKRGDILSHLSVSSQTADGRTKYQTFVLCAHTDSQHMHILERDTHTCLFVCTSLISLSELKQRG